MISFRLATIAVVIGLLGFVWLGTHFAQLTGGRSLDFVFTRSGLIKTISNYSLHDIALHIWGTKVLDMVFPLVYGVSIAVVLGRYISGHILVVLVSLLCLGVVFDYLENKSNLDLLNGSQSFSKHLFFTWLKFLTLAAPIFVGLKHYLAEVKRSFW